MNTSPRIGVDLMGSDTPPDLLLQAVLRFAEMEKGAQCVLFATREILDAAPPSLENQVVDEVITMEDSPARAVREKKKSSLCRGIDLLHKKQLDAFVSAGNTGALLLAATTTLKRLPNIDRPALLTLLPTKGKEVAVLDVGANLSLQPQHLLQLATMGIAYQKTRGIQDPLLGLLNIGSEAKKGGALLQETYQMLETLNREKLIFVGNIEGKDVFQGKIDVLVTDGFTGNVFLKTAEGIARFIFEELEAHIFEECSPHLRELLKTLRHRLHYAEYPGAILCGVEGIVVKCHGDSTPDTFINGIKGAIRLVRHNFLGEIKAQLNG